MFHCCGDLKHDIPTTFFFIFGGFPVVGFLRYYYRKYFSKKNSSCNDKHDHWKAMNKFNGYALILRSVGSFPAAQKAANVLIKRAKNFAGTSGRTQTIYIHPYNNRWIIFRIIPNAQNDLLPVAAALGARLIDVNMIIGYQKAYSISF